MKACITAAVLGSVHLGTARSPAERWIIHNTPLRWGCLGLMLTARATPVLGAGAFVLVNTFHTGTSILAGITFTLCYIFTDDTDAGPGAIDPADASGRTDKMEALGTSEMDLMSNKIF